MEISLATEQDALPAAYEHQPVEFTCPPIPGARLALAVDGRPLEAFLRPGDSSWRWRWNPGAAVGLRELRLEADHGAGVVTLGIWRLRVVPGKIDQERYGMLLEDVERLAAGLAFALGGAGSEGAAPAADAPRGPTPAEEYYALFAERLEAFERAVRRIFAR
ncbi:MAG TPA: DUF2357 domain-containing protein, partial [Roseiflexaceae bacterium]|nr:DUF2357 domain-containing protein [Roseiflexaceae bacterium]